MSAMEFISNLSIAAVPVITVIVFLVCEAVKATPLDEKWLPVVAGFSGGALGIAATFLMEDFTAKDPLTCVARGTEQAFRRRDVLLDGFERIDNYTQS